MRKILGIRTALAALGAFVLLGGCTSKMDGSALDGGAGAPAKSTDVGAPPAEDGGSEPSAPSEPADVNHPCGLLPAESVGQALSIKNVQAKPQAGEQRTANGGVSRLCNYTADGIGGQLGALSTTVFEGNPITAEQAVAAIEQQRPGAQRVAGVGEAAVYYVDTAKKTALFMAFRVVDGTPTGVTYVGSTTVSKEQMAALVRPAIDAL